MEFKWYFFKIIAICVIVFLIQNIFEGFTDEFLLNSSQLFSKPWMLVTHMFLHGDPLHIFYNMFALAIFGSILEKTIGGKKFLLIYFVSGILAGIGSSFIYPFSLGASGAIMGITGTLAVLRPRLTVYVSYIPMPMAVAVIVWALGDFLGMFYPSDVANIAHLVGLGIGIIYGFMLREKHGKKYPRKVKYYQIGEKEFEEWENRWM